MEIREHFEGIGGQFFSPPIILQERLKGVRGFVFDWDGVFNTGTKSGPQGSPFTEPDSMGLNMLRFSYWLIHGELPFVAILTGANNRIAIDFAEREHLHAVVLNAKDKGKVLARLGEKFSISPEEIAFSFDDILDLGAAQITGLRFCVQRPGSPLFTDYVKKNGLAEYLTGAAGGSHAVREICELLIGLNGNYEETIAKRVAFSGPYATYLSQRQAIHVFCEGLNQDKV